MRMLLLISLMAMPVWAQEPGPRDEKLANQDAKQMAVLIKRVGDERFTTREWAGRKMVELGEDVLPAIRQAISDNEPSDRALRPLITADVLMLSDLIPPSNRITEYQAEIVYAIADERYSNLRPTWLSSNAKNRIELEASLSVAVVDRLAHDAIVVACNWESFRRPKG